MARDRRKLKSFHLARRLAVSVYRTTRAIPTCERDVRSQIRRAALSVPANIAEGCARRGRGDYLRFLDIALGSASETDYLLDFCLEVNLLDRRAYDDCKGCNQEVLRTLQKLMEAVERFEP
jgi:four helix bundle protein